MFSFRLFAAILLTLVSFTAHAYTKDKVYKITVLHTNDHHGAFWKSEKGEYGMAARSTLIKRLRAEIAATGAYVLLLDSGDINTGTPESELADAEPDFKGMSMLGYDAMAVGNHEFDKPFEVLMKLQKEWANFPFLSANLYDIKTGQRLFSPTKDMKLDDLNVTILGLTTEQTPDQSIRFPKDKYRFRSPIEEAKELVPELRKKADVLIAVTHMGHYPNEQHGSRAPGDVTLARQVSGINLIVGGHTQKPLFTVDTQNGTHIVQAGEWGKHLGRVDLEVKNGEVTLKKYELIPVNFEQPDGPKKGPEIAEDPEMLNMLAPFKMQAEKTTSTIVGNLKGKFEGHRSIIRKQETNLGNFVTYLMAQSTSSDIAITDSGVIRTGLEEGSITYGHILSVHPVAFSLNYAYVNFTGQELWNYLSFVSNLTDGSFPQFYGIKVELTGQELTSVQIRRRGENEFSPIDLKATYKLAITDFIARGGDTYPVINDHPTYKVTDQVDAEVMRQYFEKHSSIEADKFAPIGNMKRN